jgi:glycosyltransferase involved in cell wall biosynthesis
LKAKEKAWPEKDMQTDPGSLPLVSIVIPVYNGANYMREAIDSALAQTYQNIEVLVVDDGSRDSGETERIAKSYGERIRYFAKENGGVASALNRGLQEMQGVFFSWLSHDDLYSPDKIKTQITRLAKIGNWEVVLYSDYLLIDDQGRVMEKRRIGKESIRNRFRLILATILNGCTLLIPKSIFNKVGLFNEKLKTTQDNEMWLRIAKSGFPFIHQSCFLVSSRIHQDQGNIRWHDIHQYEKEQFFEWALEFLKEEIKSDPAINKIIQDKLSSFRTVPGVYDGKQYWNQLLADKFDETSVCRKDWPRNYNCWLHKQQKKTFKKLLAQIPFNTSSDWVCEIGPGIGFWTRQFADMGVKHYQAFDISSAAIKQLQKTFPQYQFIDADFSEYRPTVSEQGSFELALSVLVFLHITDNEKFKQCWQNLGQMLKINSHLIVLDAVAINPLHGWQRPIGDGVFFNPVWHNKFRNLKDYQQIAAAAGFTLQKVIPAFTLTQSSFDFTSLFAFRFWNFYSRCLQKVLRTSGEKRGYVLGALLYFLDGWFTPLTGKGISSKWLVFRKTD